LFRTKFRQKIPVAAELGAIQIGPDGQIYVAVNNSGNNTSLGTIAANEDTLATSSFISHTTCSPVPLQAEQTARLDCQLYTAKIECYWRSGHYRYRSLRQDSTHFSGSPRDQIDEYSWSVFRNGSFLANSTKATFALLLQALAIIRNAAASQPMRTRYHHGEEIYITPPPANQQGHSIMYTPTVNLDANPTNAPALTYQWLTGETIKNFQYRNKGCTKSTSPTHSVVQRTDDS